jgi:hypothetical protein
VSETWPELDYAAWKDTRDTLHMWTQIAGKIRMKLTPLVNHWWNVPLYVSSRGLTTSPIPYGDRTFELVFDFIDHEFRVLCSNSAARSIPLRPQTTADFYAAVMEALAYIGVEVRIYTVPSEVPDPIRFEQDTTHASYDADAAHRFWRAILSTQNVFHTFRSRYLGKTSPVHFFWGSFDLAVTRFSGRAAPEHPGVSIMPDFVTREAYSHEVSSAGFWPGGPGVEEALFYAYAYPVPDGFNDARIGPASARFDTTMGEFVLPYEALRRSASPEAELLEFLQSPYEAAADLGGWDRRALERAVAA